MMNASQNQARQLAFSSRSGHDRGAASHGYTHTRFASATLGEDSIALCPAAELSVYDTSCTCSLSLRERDISAFRQVISGRCWVHERRRRGQC